LALIYQGRILGESNAISLGRHEQVVALLERSFNIADGFVHQDPNDQMARGRLEMAGISMADILRHSEARRSLAIYDHVLRHMAEIRDNPSFRRYEVYSLVGSAYPLRQLGRFDEARQRLDAAFERLREVKAYPAEKIKPGSEPDLTLCALADYEADRGEIQRSIVIYEELLRKIMAWEPKPDTVLADALRMSRLYAALAALHRRVHQTDLASALETQRLDLWRHWDERLPHNSFIRHQLDTANGPVQQTLAPGASHLISVRLKPLAMRDYMRISR
jgi:tetratricopeptide (TPR) repeat protein